MHDPAKACDEGTPASRSTGTNTELVLEQHFCTKLIH
jgi:hypothetical protein